MPRYYFDYAATSPVDPEVVGAMEPFWSENFGNPSSPHETGRKAHKALEASRETVAKFIGAKPEEIVFTSCATEANNQALMAAARSLRKKGDHIIISGVEHHSVWKPAEFLQKEGYEVTIAPVDGDGLVDPSYIEKAVTDKTILISVIHANNEIGTIEPVADVGAIARKKKILFHTDAVQSIGQIPVHVETLNADLLSIGGHKFYGPKGIGALYVRKGVEIEPFLFGGDQERGRRGGTVNVAFAAGLAKAVELCRQKMDTETKKQTQWRDHLFVEIPKRISGVKINGHRTKRLPKNVHISIDGVSSEALLLNLDMAGICASMGSACTSGSVKVSRVLKSIGLSDEMALSSLRISLGRWTTDEDVEYLLNELEKIVKKLRK